MGQESRVPILLVGRRQVSMAVVPMPDPSVRPDLEPGSEPSISSHPDVTPEEAREAKKREKVRAAWISFAGRIVAQVVGAMVTVALTLVVVQRVQLQQQPAAQADATAATTTSPEAASTARGLMPIAAARAEPVIAVLPLDDYSNGPSQHAFADGMMEALIAQLAQNQAVRVISRTSSMRYRGSGKALPAIARELGATLVVEGSVARDGGRIRVTAQLIDAATDHHVWAATYDSHGEDLTVQAEVAAAIARGVVASLGMTSRTAPANPPIADSAVPNAPMPQCPNPPMLQSRMPQSPNQHSLNESPIVNLQSSMSAGTRGNPPRSRPH
jgi:TolB-like protein